MESLFLLQQAVARRYDPETRVLDLSEFVNDSSACCIEECEKRSSCVGITLRPSGAPRTLARDDVMVAVLRAARVLAFDAVGVKAARNGLSNLEFFSNLTWALPSVAGLDLSGNEVRQIVHCHSLIKYYSSSLVNCRSRARQAEGLAAVRAEPRGKSTIR